MIDPLKTLLVWVGVAAFIAAGYLLVRLTRRRGGNRHVWGTVFESFSHYVQPVQLLKEPEQEMVKQKRNTGDPPAPDRN